ncbi:MAG: S8 family serine peptidase [Sulfurimonas sp.]|jgi:subtilisin family serine protease|nr:S8 family serine peptidase [Sulfurimonas sp.]
MRTILYSLVIATLLFNGCSDSNSSYLPIDAEPSLPASSNPLYSEQWALNYDATFYTQNGIDPDAHINAQNILDRYKGVSIRVAIIDDGFDTTHPEIKDKIVATHNVSQLSTTTDVSHSSSDEYHGTAVAGILAAKSNAIGITGIASEVELVLIKIPMNSYTDAIGIRAFDLAEQAGADIISCSWGTGDVSDAVREKIIDVATNGRNGRGTLIVFAAGNSNALMQNDESSIDEVIAVGATDRENLRTYYSSFGPQLDIMAPGGYDLGITTIDPQGDAGASPDAYNRFDQVYEGEESYFIGTSAAAPIIAGSLALSLERDSSQTRQELFEKLRISTTQNSQNVPYLYDMISTPTFLTSIQGQFGSSGFSEFHVRLTSQATPQSFGPYSINSLGEGEWSADVTDQLAEGNYTIEVLSLDDNTTFATDSFSIDSTQAAQVNKQVLRNDFYGYGKIDLMKLIYD